jgi:hypothetical protein
MGSKRIFFLSSNHNGLGIQPDFYSAGKRDTFSGGESGRIVKLAVHLNLATVLNMCRMIPLSPVPIRAMQKKL